MTETQVYWWLMLDNIKSHILGVTIIFGIISGVLFIACIFMMPEYEYDEEEKEKKIKSSIKIGIYLAITLFLSGISFCVSSLTPSSKQYAVIKVFPLVVNSDVAKELPQDAKEMYLMAKSYIKEMMSVKK